MAIAKLSKWSLLLTAAAGSLTDTSSLLQLRNAGESSEGVDVLEGDSAECFKHDANNNPRCHPTSTRLPLTKPAPTTAPPTTAPPTTAPPTTAAPTTAAPTTAAPTTAAPTTAAPTTAAPTTAAPTTAAPTTAAPTTVPPTTAAPTTAAPTTAAPTTAAPTTAAPTTVAPTTAAPTTAAPTTTTTPPEDTPVRNGAVQKCKVYGDPHVESFNGAISSHIVVDGVHIRDSVNYKRGTFWLVRAPDVQIQGVLSGGVKNYLTKLMVSGSAIDNKLLVIEGYGTKRSLTFDGTTNNDPYFAGSFGSGSGAIQVKSIDQNKFKLLIKSARVDLVAWILLEHLHVEIFMNEGAGLKPGLCGRFQGKADDIQMLTSPIAYVKAGKRFGSFPVADAMDDQNTAQKVCDSETKRAGRQCCEGRISALAENRVAVVNACVFDYCRVGGGACQEDATFVNSFPADQSEAMKDLAPTTCWALDLSISDDYCTTNCLHVPPNCPPTLCECE